MRLSRPGFRSNSAFRRAQPPLEQILSLANAVCVRVAFLSYLIRRPTRKTYPPVVGRELKMYSNLVLKRGAGSRDYRIANSRARGEGVGGLWAPRTSLQRGCGVAGRQEGRNMQICSKSPCPRVIGVFSPASAAYLQPTHNSKTRWEKSDKILKL